MVTKTKIHRIAERIAKEYSPEKIILFGSYAWGEPDINSDVDLLIIKNTSEHPIDRQVKVRNILARLRKGIPLDILVLTPEELRKRLEIGDAFCHRLLENGLEIYAV